MPKISRHGGATYEEGRWPGSSSSASEPEPTTTTGSSGTPSPSPAPSTDTPSSPDQREAGSSSAPLETGSTPETTSSPSESDAEGTPDEIQDEYTTWSYKRLLDECGLRNLSKAGTMAALADRLRADDAEKAASQ